MKKITLSLLVIISLFLNSCTEISGFKELDSYCRKKVIKHYSSETSSGEKFYFLVIEDKPGIYDQVVRVKKKAYSFYKDEDFIDCSYGLAKF